MAIKTLRVFQEFTSEGYIPMPVDGNIDYGYTIAGTFPSTTPSTFQTDDPDLDVTLTETTDYYVWIRSHGTAWNPMYTRNVRVYPDSPSINNVVMGIIIASLNSTVPYTGAIDNVDLGEFGIKAGYVELDTTPTGTPITEGTISWDSGNGTANLTLKGGNVNLAIGQEMVARVYNDTGVALTDGQIVYITGAHGNRVKVGLASNATEMSSSVTFGMVTEPIAIGAEGFVTVQGTVNHLNTSGLTEGASLWLGNTPGTYTATKPTAPLHAVLIGYVERVHATVGSIYVKVQNGYELEELHDVLIDTPLTNDVLIYNGVDELWENKPLVKTNGYIPYFDTTDLFKDSNIYFNGTNIGINTTSPAGIIHAKASTGNGGIIIDNTGTTGGGFVSFRQNGVQQGIIGVDGAIQGNTSTDLSIFSETGNGTKFFVNGLVSNPILYLTQNGYTLVGYNSAYNSDKLQVNGSVWVNDNITATSFIKNGGTSVQYLMADGSVSTLTNPITGTGTANELAYFPTSSTLASLSTVTYPSLIELSYVKGVTSSIQTQLGGKQPQLSGTGFVKISGTTISYDNSTYLTTASATSTYQPLLSLSAGYIPYASSVSVLSNSPLYFNGTNIGLNTTSISATFHIKGTGAYGGLVVDNTGTTGGGYISLFKNASQVGIFGVSGAIYGDTSSDMGLFSEAGSALLFFSNGNTTPAMKLTTGRNLLIRTTTDNGVDVLQVNGSASFTSTVTASNGTLIGGSSTSGYLGYWSGANTMSGSANLFWNNSTKVLGIGTVSPLLETNRNGIVVRGGSAGSEFVLQSTSSTDGTYDGFSMAMEVNQAYLYNKRNGSIRFGANNALKAELKTNGDFDITGAYLVNGVPISTSGITGTMTSGFLPKATGTSTVGDSILYDNGSSIIGLGTTSPVLFTDRQGLVIRGTGAELVLQSTNSTNGTYNGFALSMDGDEAYVYNKRNGGISFGANDAFKAKLFANGDFGIEGRYYLGSSHLLADLSSTMVRIAYGSSTTELGLFGGTGSTEKMISITSDIQMLSGKNFSFGNSPDYGGGSGVVYIKNASSNPSFTPSGGGILYTDGGALKFRGSSGTVTTIANA